MRSPKPISYVGLLSVAIAAATFLVIVRIPDDRLRALGRSHGVVIPTLFVLAKIASRLIAPIGATPFFLAAEPLFGIRGGFAWLFVGDFAGYCLSFLLTRGSVQDIGATSQSTLGVRSDITAVGSSIRSLLCGRLFLFGLQDFVSYGAGLTDIPFVIYAGITATSTFAQTLVGIEIGRLLRRAGMVPLMAYATLTVMVIPKIWVRVQRRRLSIR